ncbi:hypothetical protein J4Q44_G00156000 [Coregonus suidteri]|uniref:Uncharacterized protein n=1 Tax=Coregonus suidteri TaxID=861788 RepID=A0AAN8LZM2_9TELE
MGWMNREVGGNSREIKKPCRDAFRSTFHTLTIWFPLDNLCGFDESSGSNNGFNTGAVKNENGCSRRVESAASS